MILRFVRYGLPVLLVLVGLGILILDRGSGRYEGFAMCVGAGASIALLNVLYRFGAAGDRERDEEDAAREYFSQHGRWPDER